MEYLQRAPATAHLLIAAFVLWICAGPAFAATVHIVAFGDSATAGYLVPQERAYPAQLKAALRKKGGLGRLDLSGVAIANGTLYAQWNLTRGKYRAGDGQHFNGEGYAILVARMLPQIERLIKRTTQK